MENTSKTKLNPWPGAAVITVAALLAYLPLLGAYFRDDDFAWLHIAQGWQQNPALLPWGHMGITPAYNVFFYAAFLVGGTDSATPYFALNLIWHALASLGVAWLAYQLLKDWTIAFVAGLTFALLFVHHEAVGWVGAGQRLLEFVLVLLTLNLWLLRGAGNRWPLVPGVVCAILAPLAKDSGFVLGLYAVLLVAIGFADFVRKDRRLLIESLLWFGLPYLAYFLWRAIFPPHVEPVSNEITGYRLGGHIFSNFVMCVPQVLVPDLRFANYQALLTRFLPSSLAGIITTLSLISIVALFIASCLLVWRGNRITRFCVLWSYVAFLPFAPFAYSFAMAPRYLYVPSMGLCILIAVWVVQSRRRLAGHRFQHMPAFILGVFLCANLLLLLQMERNRLRDSQVRRQIIQAVKQRVPQTSPSTIYLLNLPPQFKDIPDALTLWNPALKAQLSAPPKTRTGTGGVFIFDKDNPGALLRVTGMSQRK